MACNYASALALTSLVFKESDPTYAAQLLGVARKLYNFGDTYRGKYSDNMQEAAGFYNSYSYNDELAFAAAVMALATDEQVYKTAATNFWTQFGLSSTVQTFFDWDNKNAGIAVIMSKVFPTEQVYKTQAQAHCDFWISTERRTPKGLVYINDWGSLRHAANAAFGCLLVADAGIGNAARYHDFAKQQIDYALGSTGRSFVVGFGVNPPTKYCATYLENLKTLINKLVFNLGSIIEALLALIARLSVIGRRTTAPTRTLKP